ncbi:MAG: ribulose-phosphate 3-epimerase [Coriobacteriales bacterium]|nr:ribulose-phosphate 3-epimerase [Coriobacteriales bacterium]
MAQAVQISPSILSADFANFTPAVQAVSAAGADWIHVDVMDGHFVPNITIGTGTVSALKKVTRTPLDVHLMVDNPDVQVPWFIDAGADLITFHLEAAPHANRIIQQIHAAGRQAGVAINPSTPVCLLEDVVDDADLILVMSVNPGFGGQSYLPASARKVRQVAQLLAAHQTDALIEVDGGIKEKTAPLVTAEGANVLVAGSAVFHAPDPAAAIEQIRRAGLEGMAR